MNVALRKITAALLTLLVSFTLTACSDDDDDDEEQQSNPLSLKILHINDHHSHLEQDDIDFEIGGIETTVEMGGFPRVVSKFKELAGDVQVKADDDGSTGLLKLHAGDAVTGTLYYTLFAGEADADLMNLVCFDAFALGNHEFDAGDAGLKTFLDYLSEGDCDTPVLAANVKPEVGVSPLTPTSETDYIQPFVVKDFEGEMVGIIGIDIAQKTKVSSNPDDTTEFLDETETAQQYIDELAEAGINKIILLTHYQYDNDLAMAPNLDGVDVIIGGDSHSLLGDGFDALGLSPQGPYPTMTTDMNGNKVCVAQAWQYSNLVGELDVEFDAEGNVVSCDGTPHLLLGAGATREDAEGEDYDLTGAEYDEVLNFVDAHSELSILEPDATAQSVLEGYSGEVEELTKQVIGTAAENLCFERIPGQGRSEIPGCTELTAQNGGDITQLVAHAYREQIGGIDIAIQNAGGVRIDIPAGPITIADAYELLPFSNTMVQLEMTGAEIRQALEQGVANFQDNGGSSGSYPYAGGLRWDLDLTQPFGSRFSNLEAKRRGETDWMPLAADGMYTVVTNSFAAGGGDGYTVFEDVSNDGRSLDTFLEYAQTFIDYVESVQVVMKLPVSEYSTQNFTPAE